MPIEFIYKKDSLGKRTKDLEKIYYSESDAPSKIKSMGKSVKTIRYFLRSEKPLFSAHGVDLLREGEDSYILVKSGFEIFLRDVLSVTEITDGSKFIINIREGGYFEIEY